MIIYHPEYLLPIGLLILLFILKVVVDKKFEREDILMTIIEMAIDISSLAISFLISYIIAITNKIANNEVNMINPTKQQLIELCGRLNGSIFLIIVYAIILITVIIINKRVSHSYRINNDVKYILWGLSGYIISIPALWYSIILLKSVGGVN